MTLLEMLSGVGTVLDTPGAFVRTGLAGENPFPGIFDPEQRVSGRSLLERLGVLDPNTEGLDAGDVGGFLAEMLTDPLTVVPGYMAGKYGINTARMAQGFKKAGGMSGLAEETLEAMRPQSGPFSTFMSDATQGKYAQIAQREAENDKVMQWLSRSPAVEQFDDAMRAGPHIDAPHQLLGAEPDLSSFKKDYYDPFNYSQGGSMSTDIPVYPGQEVPPGVPFGKPSITQQLEEQDELLWRIQQQTKNTLPPDQANAFREDMFIREHSANKPFDAASGFKIIGDNAENPTVLPSPEGSRIHSLNKLDDQMRDVEGLLADAPDDPSDVEHFYRTLVNRANQYEPEWWLAQPPYGGAQYGIRKPITLDDILRGYQGHSLLLALLGGGALGGMAMQGGES